MPTGQPVALQRWPLRPHRLDEAQRFGFEDRVSRFEPQAKYDPQEHEEWCARFWRRMDRDCSGTITLTELNCEEFQAVLKKAIVPTRGSCLGGPKYARAQMNMDQAMRFFMRKADLNGDMSISFQEFRSFMKVLRCDHGDFQTADMIWALFDVDTDGMISESEFREIFRFYLGHEATEEQFRSEWAKLDTEAVGKVAKDDYVEWLRLSSDPIFRCHAPMNELAEEETMSDARSLATCDAAVLPPAASRSAGQWRPWDSYRHFCWNGSSTGKPDQARDTSETMSSCGKSSAQQGGSSGSGSRPRLSSSMQSRPEWNWRLATAHPNWPDKNGKPHRIVQQRQFFQRPQSLPELKRHLDSKRGMTSHKQALFSKDDPKRRSYLSSEYDVGDGGASQLLSIPGRGKPLGSMRHPYTRERKQWNDAWYDPPQMSHLYHPAPSTSVGPPPRHLYAYDDDNEA